MNTPRLSPLADPGAAGGAPLAQAEPLDLIFIEGFRGDTVIGIHDSELHRPQPLVIDVCAGLPRAGACDTDQIADTIDYGVLRERLNRLMAEHGVTLLEALAEQIAHIAIDEFGAHWVRVKVVKPRKFDNVEAVGVQIERRRAPVARSAATPAAVAAPAVAGAGAAVLRLIGNGMVPSAS